MYDWQEAQNLTPCSNLRQGPGSWLKSLSERRQLQRRNCFSSGNASLLMLWVKRDCELLKYLASASWGKRWWDLRYLLSPFVFHLADLNVGEEDCQIVISQMFISKGASLTPAWCSDLTPPLPPNSPVEYVADSIKDLEEGKATREIIGTTPHKKQTLR